HADATMETYSTLAGETSREQLEVSAKPVMAPILSVNMNAGETWCSRSPCWLDKLDTALVYKGEAYGETNVDANATIPGTIAPPGLDLIISTVAGYSQEIITTGARYQFGKFTVGATAEMQRWSQLEDLLEDDDIKSDANIQFKDIVIPRIGVQYQFNEQLTLTSGIAYEES